MLIFLEIWALLVRKKCFFSNYERLRFLTYIVKVPLVVLYSTQLNAFFSCTAEITATGSWRRPPGRTSTSITTSLWPKSTFPSSSSAPNRSSGTFYFSSARSRFDQAMKKTPFWKVLWKNYQKIREPCQSTLIIHHFLRSSYSNSFCHLNFHTQVSITRPM